MVSSLLDADLRRPRMHKVFEVENDVRFTSLLLRTPKASERAVHRLDWECQPGLAPPCSLDLAPPVRRCWVERKR